MRAFKLIISSLLTGILFCLLQFPIGKLPFVGSLIADSPAASLPALGPFVSPFHGVWQTTKGEEKVAEEINISGNDYPVKVIYDERMVPHIFAETEHDLYVAQGYVCASHRLWQMDFIRRAAAGKLSEVIGKRALPIDQTNRRLGLLYAAEKTVEVAEKDKISNKVVSAFVKGVNAYIKNLKPADYPIEFKLLGYAPEEWEALNAALLMKYMTKSLAARESDVEMSNLKKLFDPKLIEQLFPTYPSEQSPIIPSSKEWDFRATPPTLVEDSVDQAQLYSFPLLEKPHPYNGSNNWAVSGSKTKNGNPILCNDPHLELNLPSIWYEVQLHAPGINVYGVTIPGAPGVIIGFNEDISWGVTNAGRDVMDWYRVTFKDEKKDFYLLDGQWEPTTKRQEIYEIKDAPDIEETITFTHHGPVVYEDTSSQRAKSHQHLALKWKGHDASNDILAFYYLNRAKNHSDYLKALDYYECPGQNFAFIDRTGDIAICQQGKFPLRNGEEGRIVRDGTIRADDWQGYIPSTHNPRVLNPPRGFVSSANQHPTDEAYPYGYNGRFEHYRNRRLNQELERMNDITVEDMQALQTDNFGLHAKEALEVMLPLLEKNTAWDQEAKETIQLLQKWDFMYETYAQAPTIFEIWWLNFYRSLWDEFSTAKKEAAVIYPNKFETVELMRQEAQSPFFDVLATSDKKETLTDLVIQSFQKTLQTVAKKKKELGDKPLDWLSFRKTQINHLARLPAFSRTDVAIGGNRGILNAMSGTHGPSWRMIVEMTPDGPKAWGNNPGGQLGNPSSQNYDSQLSSWADGEYYELYFLENADKVEENWQLQRLK